MILYIIRHAWAADRDDPRWTDDRLRPLTDEGYERFTKLVKALGARGFAPGVIATSPLARCRQTADILANNLPDKPAVVEREELAPGSDLAGIVRWTNRQSNRYEEIAWVGHAPDVGRMASSLVGNPRGAIRFAKGGIASIHFDGPSVELSTGELWWLLTAKILGC